MENVKNTNPTAYLSTGTCDRQSLFNDGFYSKKLKISEVREHQMGLIVCLEEPRGQTCPYILTSGEAIRLFISDMDNQLTSTRPLHELIQNQNLKDKEVEVFFKPGNSLPVALSPIYAPGIKASNKGACDLAIENIVGEN